MSKVIVVENLIKKYKGSSSNAVDGVSFDVKEGEFFALLGPNGAGKTTTISILNTTLSKTSGHIEVAGFDTETEQDKVRGSIGVIFQKPSLDMNLTGEENVRFHACLYGMYSFAPSYGLMPASYKKKVNDLAEVLTIDRDIFKPVKSYSGGMLRKLEIVRGLIHNPKVLFLDEPTTGLDPLSRKSLWDYLVGVRKETGMTVFLTTHYLDEAESVDRLCVVDDGKVVEYGTPGEMKKRLIKASLEIDSKDREGLIGEINKMGVKFNLDKRLSITLNKSTDAQEIIGKLKTKLSYLQIESPTLEEAYLKLISK